MCVVRIKVYLGAECTGRLLLIASYLSGGTLQFFTIAVTLPTNFIIFSLVSGGMFLQTKRPMFAKNI